MNTELEKLYRDFGYWKVQEEIVKNQLAVIGKKIGEELSKPTLKKDEA